MISVVIPVIRPQNIPRLLECLKEAITIDHEILYTEDTERIGAPKMVKKLVDSSKGDWVCFLGDDTLPYPKSIDLAHEFAIKGDYWLVGLNDQHSRKPTHWLASKKLLEKLANQEFFYTGYFHNFCDDELRIKADAMGKYAWCEQAKLDHNHPVFKTAPMDEHYKRVLNQERWEHDKKLFQQRCCKLSVAIIAKNEEVMLPRCLRSVREADEIIVVDTGSTDQTVEIAKQWGAKIGFTPWEDDFSKARNYAKSLCTGDWILSIDADEYLDEDVIPQLKELMLTSKDAIGIQLKSGTMKYHVPRLFRNKPNVFWYGRIHELVNVSDFDKCHVGITFTFSPAHALDPDRNLRMLEKAAEESPGNARILYYLGREYGYRRAWAKAISTLEQYLVIGKWLPERADAHFIKALCHWNNGEGEKARECCLSALNINANFEAACSLMASMSFEHNAKQWRKMAETATNENTLFARKRFDTI